MSDPSKASPPIQNLDEIREKEENIALIREELDSEFSSLLANHLGQLEKISVFTDSVAEKLRKHYCNMFPKKCNSCGREFANHNDYLNQTEPLKNQSTLFDHIGLQEYRNCPCGSTLLLWGKDRRDNTRYGIARRKLFDECLRKLQQLSDAPTDELRQKLREVFSKLAE